jgi:hypothetical protein
MNATHLHKPYLIGRIRWHPQDDDLNSGGPLLLRDLFGPLPLHRRTHDASCLTQRTIALASAIYDERIMPSGYLDSMRLAVLADALEDAGCTDDAILDHLRSPGTHVRGCWTLDLILGKE